MKSSVVPVLLASLLASAASAQQGDFTRLIDEGMNHSQLMLTASELMDGIGGRLTNSPNSRRAEDWAIAKFRAAGLSNAHRESFEFGRGWDFTTATARMVEPRLRWMTTIPVAWTPGTNGTPIRAPIVVAPMSKLEHFAAWRGKLDGKIVLVTLPGTTDEPTDPVFKRLTDEDIAKKNPYEIPHFDPEQYQRRIKEAAFAKQLDDFLVSEGAVAIVRKSYRNGGLVSGEGYNYQRSDSLRLPEFELAAEEYRRLTRLAKTGPAPVIELSSDAHFEDSSTVASNVIADIPGTNPKAGYVMAGAHFDSWIAADGASDNGAGSVVMLEAARLLKAIGARPMRTIRFALWEGEEQALLGSRAYIEQHLASRPMPPNLNGDEAYYRWPYAFPITPRPGYYDLKAYFNLDNGSGRIRGLYSEGNLAAENLLKSWLGPFGSLDATRIVAGRTGGTDHVFFQAVGVPAYQFIQDPLDYSSRVHHSNIDTVDHMRGDDLRQAAVVIAGMLLEAANDKQELPHPVLPTQPAVSDPFAYSDPDK